MRISPHQIAWNTAYSRSGGLSFILVKHLSSGDLFLFRGASALDLGRSGLATEAEFRGSGYDNLWAAIRGSGIRGSGIIEPWTKGQGLGHQYNSNNKLFLADSKKGA